MKLNKTKFNGLYLIDNTYHKDERGFFKEIFRYNQFKKQLNLKNDFCQDNLVKSSKYVLEQFDFLIFLN